MRTRDRDEDWIEELGRRRLEALIAELTPSGEPPPPSAPSSPLPSPSPLPPPSPLPASRGSSPDRPAAEPALEPGRPVDVTVLEEPPGRHARRALAPSGRVRGWLADRLPEVTGRQALQQGHVGVLALVLATALVLGGWAWMRSSSGAPAPVAAPVVTSSGASPAATGSPALLNPSSGTPGAPGAAGASPATEVVVHVAGKVRRPGIVVLPVGSRVVDAVRRAGGFAAGVGPRSASLNLARVLVDGEQIVVGAAASPAAGPVLAPTDGASAGPLVSLNTADQTALESLPGVGPVTATAILQWRSEHGPFTAVEELLEVSGIGEATLAEIEPHVTL
ncbi:helix-hairpin-helix domain-containing protein [Nocardioides marmoribigeumensis]|uniref:Competence protein ComEA n=1 Tax=Nocardioides marmoribigeumensis TaxID=433649 RepID=A0ABU2C0Q5_9ACTN|nr:helix-hairpin-helix domain-containing protein [Nocardioides marmoribigeumensis]MDR7364259.1 competence protein ComEA [Nocardioides marmoribigeumensis]